MKRMAVDETKRDGLAKEVIIHQQVNHQNIIKFHEAFEEGEFFYMVQELAVGGELFELIEPDCGFPEQVVHFYFVQLISAIVRLSITLGSSHSHLAIFAI